MLQSWQKIFWWMTDLVEKNFGELDRVCRKQFNIVATQMAACVSNQQDGGMARPKHVQYE